MEWQDISTAPHGESIIVCVSAVDNPTYPNGHAFVTESTFEDGIWMRLDCTNLENRFWKVTHWQPLPKPPVQG